MKVYQAIDNWGIGSEHEFCFLISTEEKNLYSKTFFGGLDFFTSDYLEGDSFIGEFNLDKS